MNNKSSFKSSVVGLQGNLLSFALKLTLNPDEARDLVQDTTLKALNNEEKYVDNTNMKGWLMTIMRNIFINNYRRSVRENTVVDTTDDCYHINLAQDSAAFDSTEGAFAASEISSIIATFPDVYRRPFTLHIAGYKYEEIAEMLKLPLGTVKSRIFIMRASLRKILKDYR